MNIFCALAGHNAARGVYNSGFHFSRCRRCGLDMIRSEAGWGSVPGGHRVAWKAGRHSHSLEPNYQHVLPVLHAQANLPAVRSTFASWSRQLVRMMARARARDTDRDANEAEAKGKEPYPPLLVIVALVGAGLQLLLRFGSARGRFA